MFLVEKWGEAQAALLGQPASSAVFTEVPTSLASLIRVTIEIDDIGELAGVEFSTELMESAGGQMFYLFGGATSPQVQYQVPYTFANNLLNFNLDGSLPVEWSHFSAFAHPAEKTVKLDWATLIERNNDRFEVEKSFDNYVFASVGSVKAVGQSDELQPCGFEDRSEMRALNYYRLSQVDLDGATSYSQVVEVRMPLTKQVLLSPNPAQNVIALTKSPDTAPVTEIALMDAMGRLVSRFGDGFMGEERMEISVSNLPSGLYQLRVHYQGGAADTHTVRIQH